jgi:hypothetical protein
MRRRKFNSKLVVYEIEGKLIPVRNSGYYQIDGAIDMLYDELLQELLGMI